MTIAELHVTKMSGHFASLSHLNLTSQSSSAGNLMTVEIMLCLIFLQF